MKKNVLIVHNYYQIPGGEDTVVANEVEMLRSNGHKVIVYTRHNSEIKEYSKIQKILLAFSTFFNLRTYREVKNIIKANHIDIVHVHNTLNLVSPSVYYAGFRCKVPVVQTVHNFRMLCPGATFFRDGNICEDCVTKGLGCAIKHKCYRNSMFETLACVLNMTFHRIIGTYGRLNYICLTEFNKNKLLKLRQIKEENVYVKPNFLFDVQKIIPYKDRKLQIVFAGRLDQLKGIDTLLEAWSDLKDENMKLIICGTGPLESWCKEYIKNNEMKNVEMRGFLSNEEVRAVMAESLALILPTKWYEGFPMTIIEAFSVGTIVLGSDLGNVGSILKNNSLGVVFHKKDIQETLRSVPCLAMNITEQEQNESAKQYCAESNYQIMSEIYEKISK